MFEQLPWYIQSGIKITMILLVALLVEKMVTRYLRNYVRRAKLPREVEGAFIPLARFAIIVGCVMAIMEIGGLPTGWFAAFMGLGGAVIGFASSRSIGNFIAGLYILISRPFRVGDYIRVDGIEGVVKEITINYTKILTPANTTVLMNNQEILGRNVVNFRLEEGGVRYCYSFEIGFDHSVPADRLHKIFEEIVQKYSKILPRRPEYCPISMNRSERRYMFYLYVNKSEDIFTLQPKFLNELITAWDGARLRFV